MSKPAIKCTLKLERETKNTALYVAEQGSGSPVRNAYVELSAFEGEPPKRVTVTVDPEE